MTNALTRQQALELPAADLDAAVELHVIGRQPCQCPPAAELVEGLCPSCGGTRPALWSSSWAAAMRLRDLMGQGDYQARKRFVETLPACISRRLQVGRVYGEQVLLVLQPEDVA